MHRDYADHHPYRLIWTDRFGSGEAVHVLAACRHRPDPHRPGATAYAGEYPDDPAAARRAVARILRECSTPAAALRWARHELDYEVPAEAWRPGERDRLVRRLEARCEREGASEGDTSAWQLATWPA